MISRIIKVEVVLSAELKAEADNTYGDLDYNFRISLKPNLVILFYYTLF